MKTGIETERLLLRRLTLEDVPLIQKYCHDRSLSKWIPVIPHPYTKKNAREFVVMAKKQWTKKTDYTYGIQLDDLLVGCIGLHVKKHDAAEIGYWLGKEYRGQGIVPEAAHAVMTEAFKSLRLHRIYAKFLEGNNGSGRVMKKLGMQKEGVNRDADKVKNKYFNSITYSILRNEFR
ncbi:MAG: GNAT family protein [Nanoarchaeota archaeon]